MELSKEKKEVYNLDYNEAINYVADKMIELSEELAADAGFSGAMYECVKANYVMKEFRIGSLGGKVLNYEDLLNPNKLHKVKYDFMQLEKELAKKAEELLVNTPNPTDDEVELWMSYIEKARHNY